jgi:hypothetical protein
MSQTPSVIYLPPGVIPAGPATAASANPGVPFDRSFFERLLPEAVKVFCRSVDCQGPLVEVFTIDGTVHFVNAISGVTDTFVALQTSRESHDHTMQVFLPYQTIYRVEIHPESDENRRRLGFNVDAKIPPAVQPPSPAPKALKSPGGKRSATKSS